MRHEMVRPAHAGAGHFIDILFILTFFSKKSPLLKRWDELRQVLDRVINTHYTKISRKQRKADR